MATSPQSPDSTVLSMVDWFRHSAPYIHAHRGKTFVLMLPGEALLQPAFLNTIHDIALLNNLGVRLVLSVVGRHQIDASLTLANIKSRFHQCIRLWL